EFEVIDIIGRGSFGQITKVRRLSDGLVMARKEISYKAMNPKEKSQLISEFRILKNLQHPNIVRYYHHEHIPEIHMVYLYMEYCGGGDLGSLILQCSESGELVPEHIIWGIFTQLILALYRCHYNNDPPPVGNLFCFHDDPLPPSNPSTVILHRDIKPDNIFLDKDNSVKVGDFGLAKMLDQEHFFANTYVGTPYYMSPDVLLDQPYTPQSDIWSLGCVIYELCKLNPPFQAKTHMQLTQKIKEGVFPPIPDVYSSTLSRTIAACLNLNPANRPTTATLLRLDIIKLCRKERNVLETHMTLLALEEKLKERERALVSRESAITNDLEAYKLALETDIFKRLENDLHQTIEMEVERRVGDRL
ncbi:kinase-like protein, partial [Nadsonia fulvescens var. elongata DSM 6958]